MSLAPSPSSGRGEVILQPAYFTSSAFVHAARADVDCLVHEYSRQYTRSAPFALFKDIWQRQGWTWIQFKVFDTRTRAAFLRVMMRLFLERIGAGDPLLNRAAALFGLYTMYSTQPSTSTPSLYSAARVQVTCDLYREMMMLPDALDGEHLHPIRPYVIYILSNLLQAHVFHVLPHADTHPLGPRALPREVVTTSTGPQRKHKGRPSKREGIAKARESLVALDGWCGGASPPSTTQERYVLDTSALLSAMGPHARASLEEANRAVAERIEMIKNNK